MNGRNVIVTGGFGTLGQAVAAVFAADGWRVARVDYSPKASDESAGMLDISSTDLSDPEAASAAVDRVVAECGGVDALINVAGGFTWETLGDGSPQAWERMFRVNLLTAATMTRAALPALLRSDDARIVNIGAGAALKAEQGMGAYAASKSGVHRLTESLAAELAGKPVTVNAILPSIIDTPANRAAMPDEDFSQWVRPRAIAEIILFLASPAGGGINGALIPVTRSG